jgi:uncharacterized Zn finger protein (UPF0148 family)
MSNIQCKWCKTTYDSRGAINCPNCGTFDGPRTDEPLDIKDPILCLNCETWHESNDRIPYDGNLRGRQYTMCPHCEDKDADIERPPQMGAYEDHKKALRERKNEPLEQDEQTGLDAFA